MRMKGFTLIEMVMAMVLLGIVGLSLSGILTQSAQIYVEGTARELTLQEGRFVSERIVRELRQAVPNSVVSSNEGHCIEWLPIRAAGIYSDLPIKPEKELEIIPDGSISKEQRVVIYPVTASDIYSATVPNGGTNKTAVIAEDVVFTPSPQENMASLKLKAATLFPSASPAKRFFIFDSPVAYCLEGSDVWRYSNYALERSEPDSPNFAGGEKVLMAQNISQLQFDVDQASLVRNGLVKFHLEFNARGEKVRFDHDVLIANAP